MFSVQLLLYLTALSILMHGMTTYFLFRVWRLNLATSFTWSMLLLASVIQVGRIFWSAFFVNDIATAITLYPASVVITGFILNSVQGICLCIFAFNIWKGLKKILPPTHG